MEDPFLLEKEYEKIDNEYCGQGKHLVVYALSR